MALAKNFLTFSKFSNFYSFNKTSNSWNIQNQFGVLSMRMKHYNPKYKWLRGQKFRPVELPNTDDKKSRKEEIRSKMKELGIRPPRYWKTRPMTITTMTEILDPYVPPEGDGKASLLSKEGSKELMSSLNKKRETLFATRKIKSYDPDFNIKLFPQEAQDIYIKAHTELMNKNFEGLSEFATTRAIGEMIDGVKNKTIRWKFLHSLEPPIVVHARTEKYITDTNLFAQITVRFHTKQSLAIYDRFGRLCYGSELLAKDVLEYVVFEKHIVNVYGTWKLHGKIIPEWMTPGEPSAKTYRVEEDKPIDDDDDDDFMEEDQPDTPTKSTSVVTQS